MSSSSLLEMVPGGGLYIGNLNGVRGHYEIKPSIYVREIYMGDKNYMN